MEAFSLVSASPAATPQLRPRTCRRSSSRARALSLETGAGRTSAPPRISVPGTRATVRVPRKLPQAARWTCQLTSGCHAGAGATCCSIVRRVQGHLPKGRDRLLNVGPTGNEAEEAAHGPWSATVPKGRQCRWQCGCKMQGDESSEESSQMAASGVGPSGEAEAQSPAVGAALALLRFYKRELSPLIPGSCRYVPTCSEYAMGAFKKYGFWKGGILTAWRLMRCNPLGGSGFDPPRWFGEPKPPAY